MAREPDGCFLTTCGSPCPADSTSLWSTPCSDGSSATGLQQFRCCPGSFPDVLVLVDRGASTCNPARLMGGYSGNGSQRQQVVQNRAAIRLVSIFRCGSS
jgi:hypothetical protein